MKAAKGKERCVRIFVCVCTHVFVEVALEPARMRVQVHTHRCSERMHTATAEPQETRYPYRGLLA